MATPKKNIAYEFTITLTSSSTPGKFVVAATIAVGDFQISIDDAPFNNLETIPAVIPVGSKLVKISLSADEMNGNKINIIGSDPDDTWDDVNVFIDNPVANEEDAAITRKIIQNRQIVNEHTGNMEIYDDTDTIIEFEGTIYEDGGSKVWDGHGPIIKRNKLIGPV